jgi:hypothetical protein
MGEAVMVFGINPYVWQKRYAWRPWLTIHGQWVWMEWVEVTGFVENKDIKERTPFNCRLLSTSFCVRRLNEIEVTS